MILSFAAVQPVMPEHSRGSCPLNVCHVCMNDGCHVWMNDGCHVCMNDGCCHRQQASCMHELSRAMYEALLVYCLFCVPGLATAAAWEAVAV